MSKGCPPWAKKKKSAKFAFLVLQLTIGNINDYIWSKHVDFHL